MQQAWERFQHAWKRATPEDALRAAEREVFDHLRHDLDWSWVHSRLLAFELARAAEGWLDSAGDSASLRERLRAAWDAQGEIRAAEERRGRATVAALAGGPCGDPDSPGANRSAAAAEHVFELYL